MLFIWRYCSSERSRRPVWGRWGGLFASSVHELCVRVVAHKPPAAAYAFANARDMRFAVNVPREPARA